MGFVNLVATCVWRISPALVVALDERLGPPVDSYVNGSQTWLTDDGPDDTTLEWRLHPVAGYRPPGGCSHYDLWEQVVSGLTAHPEAGALALGNDDRPLASLWDGLECFVAHGTDFEPATLARVATETLDIAPDATGLVDHERVADAWEHARRGVSIVAMLLEQLRTSANDP